MPIPCRHELNNLYLNKADMQKNIKKHLILFIIGLFVSPSLFSQAFVDLSLSQIITPDSVIFCQNKNISIKVVVGLLNGSAVDSFQMSYQLDNRIVITEKIKRRIERVGDTIQYEFMTPLSKDSLLNSKGILKVTVTTFNPDRDYYSFNNNLAISLRSSGSKKLPYIMDFEGSTLPPIDWIDIKPNYYTAGKGGYIQSYVTGINNLSTNTLLFKENNLPFSSFYSAKSPLFDLGTADLPYLYFNHAYGNGGLDTLTVEVTKDCGATYQTLFRKGGSALWTMETYRTYPSSMSNWSLDSINLKAFVGENVQFRFLYKTITNDGLYLDDIQSG